MLKVTKYGYVFKTPSVMQIKNKNRILHVFKDDEKIKKVYIDATTMKIIKKVIEWTKITNKY